MDLKAQAIAGMKEWFGEDQRRINHALKVLNFSERIAEGERLEGDKCQVVLLTAILHDIGIQEAERKYNSNSGRYQEIEGPPIAEKMMRSMGVDHEINRRVCYIIGGHHTSSKIDGLDFQIIWEADLLVNIEEDGLDKSIPDLGPIIQKNFRTATGKKIAEDIYMNKRG